MIELTVRMELDGKSVEVGTLNGNGSDDVVFAYSEEYIYGKNGVPISISLPLRTEPFTPKETRNYFDGLLPEGFMRRTIAGNIHAGEDDYIAILKELGKECLGAINISIRGEDTVPENYEELDIQTVKALAAEGVSRSAAMAAESRMSLTGASGKVGLYYETGSGRWFLPKGCAPSTHIVKQSHIRLDSIVTNEQLCMETAGKLGLNVPSSFIINTASGAEDEVLFAVRRYDRVFAENGRTVCSLPVPKRLHQEDFAQAMGIPSSAKYEPEGASYLHGMTEILKKYSVNPGEDILKLFDMIVFCWLSGNTDAHLKNFSLLRNSSGRGIRLAPAYDMLSTVIYPSGTRNMAFGINGKYNIDKITKDDFLKAAAKEGISERIAGERFDNIREGFTGALESTAEELMEAGFRDAGNVKERMIQAAETRLHGKD